VFYLILSILLVTTCVAAFVGIRRKGKSRHMIFWLHFVPFIIILAAIIVLSLIASGFYDSDYCTSRSVEGLMRILEIGNVTLMLPLLLLVSQSTRTMPSIIMLSITSMGIIFLIPLIVIVFTFPMIAWRISKDNQVFIATAPQPIDSPMPYRATNMPNINMIVTRADPEMYPPIQQQVQRPFHAPIQPLGGQMQPPYNPYIPNSEKPQLY